MASKASRINLFAIVDRNGAEKKISVTPTIGVLAGLSGKNQELLPPLWERSFEKINPGKFDKLLQSCKPSVAFSIPDPLAHQAETEKQMRVDITFSSMQDFEPDAVACAVPALRKLLEARDRLRQFKTQADGRFKLQEVINDALKDPALACILREEKAD